ncbi:MAG: hypothetical protein LKE51_02410 [Selenomonas sp.]|nr:hypothetical protein [Selenomonas sp.]
MHCSGHAGHPLHREIARCDTYDKYQQLAEANFNLVLNPEAREAADWFQKAALDPINRTETASISLTRSAGSTRAWDRCWVRS